MSASVQLIGTDGEEIFDLDGWFAHAPPEGGDSQWVDGYSAKEQAKVWLRPGRPAAPVELEYALATAGFTAEQWTGHPEHQTKLDGYGRGDRGWRHHDMLLLLGDPDLPAGVVGIEAKACEGYDGTVVGKAVATSPSRLPERCNGMAQALFGRPVCDTESRTVTDATLGAHGYQLWTGSVGTIREAQARGVSEAVFLVHQFGPGRLGPAQGDTRPWDSKLAENAAKLREFAGALGEVPVTHQTEFVEEGTRLRVVSVCSLIADAE